MQHARIRPLGFDRALDVYGIGLSIEARHNLAKLIYSVARQYHYNDSAALRELRRRLTVAVRRKKAWAAEVQNHLTGAPAR